MAANVLYMLGVLEQPDVDWVDRQIKQMEDGNLGISISLLLLSQGLSVHGISEFDRAAFVEHGLSYLRQYFQKRWNANYDSFYTPMRIARSQHAVVLLDAEVEAHNLHRSIECRPPTLQDITSLVPPFGDAVIELDVFSSREPMTEAAIVYGSEEDGRFLNIYMPSNDQNPILRMVADDFAENFWEGYWLHAWRRHV